METKQRFYENMYQEGRVSPVPSGILWKIFSRLRRFELHRRDAVFNLLEPGGRLLDLGCGCGSLMFLARKNKFQEVYGVDIAKNVIERARKNLKKEFPKLEGIHLKLADVDEKIPYPDNFFDTVTAVAFLEHVFDPYFVVKEVKRILKHEGTFIIEVPNIAWLPHRIGLLFGGLPKTADEIGWDGGHLHYFTFAAVEKLLTKSGFEVVKKTTSGVCTPLRTLYPSLLGSNIIIKAKKK